MLPAEEIGFAVSFIRACLCFGSTELGISAKEDLHPWLTGACQPIHLEYLLDSLSSKVINPREWPSDFELEYNPNWWLFPGMVPGSKQQKDAS